MTLRITRRFRLFFTRCGSLLLLFQRSPVVQMLLPEARTISANGLGEMVKWTVATVAGLGVYDTVAGATAVPAPTISRQPSSVSINSGSTATLSVYASGSGIISYQWYKGVSGITSSPVTGANGSIFTTSNLTATTTYWVRAWNSGGSAYSSTATVSVVTPPAITSSPSSVTINSGGTTTLSVVASGTSPSYQWYLGNAGATASPISGATGSTFKTPALTQTTTYWVRASNSAGTANSGAAKITVITPPAITAPPASVTINSGGTATLTTSASGTSPAFQWYLGTTGVTTNPITGATKASFTTPVLTSTTSYWVRASNLAGSADSQKATVTVITPPTITTQPQSLTTGIGSTATFSVAASGSTATYQWYQGAAGITTNPVAGAISSTFTTVSLTADASFWVRATNAAGVANSNAATVTVVSAPTIDTQPASVSISSGGSTLLTVNATGQPPVSYQWYLGLPGVITSPINSATDTSFTTPAQTSAASYWVRVTDASWHTDSQAAIVSITQVLLTTNSAHGTVSGGGSYGVTSTATLSVAADPGYIFTGWTGDLTGMDSPIGLVMDADKTVGATYSQDTGDSDGDGLSNYEEAVIYGTNPNNPDTDGDGLTDSQEIHSTHTDPKLADTNTNGISDALEDTDGDGLTNLAELNQFGTDPLLADSNGDGLSDAYSVCYVGTPIRPRVGNRISINLKKLLATGNTLNLVGTLPAGLTFNANTGMVTGTLAGSPGTANIKVQVLQSKTVLRTVPFPITVQSFPASLIANYEGVLEDANSVPIGACRLAITAADTWTATLESAGAALRSMKGTFILQQGSPVAPVTAAFPSVPGAPAVTLTMTINGANPVIAGSFKGGTFRGFRLAAGAENPNAVAPCNLVFDAGVQTGLSIPAGLGWARGTVNKLGAGKFTGLLGDGTSVDIAIHLSATGQAVLWAQPYARNLSYVGGIITLPNLGQKTTATQTLADSVWWSKAADAKSLSYPGGFPAMPITVGTSRWKAPANAIALGASLGWLNNRTCTAVIDGAGLSNQLPQPTKAALPTGFTSDNKFNLVASSPSTSPLVAWAGKTTAADGSFAGVFTIPNGFSTGIKAGNAPASGVLLQDDAWGTVTGSGLIEVPVSGIKGSFRTAAIILNQ